MSLTQILCRLNELSVNNTQNNPAHTLEFEYPVRDLLPDAYTTPWLEPPPDIANRHQPPQQRTSLGLSCPTFSMVLCPASLQQLEGDASNAIALTRAIADRAHVSGTSKLQCAAYFDEALAQVVYRFRLVTSTFSMPAIFQLDSNDICMLFTRGVGIEWIGMLHHIISRASDRAYYHVQDNLQQYFGNEVASAEEEDLTSEWATSLGPTSIELFRRNVTTHPAEDGFGKNKIMLRLSCGHDIPMQKQEFLLLTQSDCLTMRCPLCNAPVLTEQDHADLKISQSVHEAGKCVRKHYHWTLLDTEPPSTVIHIHTTTLLKSLQAALTSFESNPLLCPSELSFVKYESTKAIMQSFSDSFSYADYTITTNSTDLISVLMQDALETRVGDDQKFLYYTVLKPGYVSDLYAWFVRVVNFVLERKCDSIEASHLGCHYHGRSFVYNPVLWEAGEEGEEPITEFEDEVETIGTSLLSTAEVDVAMNGLGASMGELNMIGATPDSLGDVLKGIALGATAPQGGPAVADDAEEDEEL